MKKRFIGVAIMMLAFVMVFGFAGIASAQNINVQIDGQNVDFPDQQPYVDRATSRTLIPIRAVTEAMGAVVTWNDNTRTATIDRNGINVKITIGSKNSVVNGVVKQIDAPATVTNGRTMVPLRFLSEAFGATVKWYGTTNTVYIGFTTTPPEEIIPPAQPVTTGTPGIDTTGMDPMLAQVVNSVADLDTENYTSDYIRKGNQSFKVQHYYDGEYRLVMSYDDEVSTMNDIHTIMKIFFPQSGDEAFLVVKQVHDDFFNNQKRYEVKKNIDGKSFECFMQARFLFVRIK